LVTVFVETCQKVSEDEQLIRIGLIGTSNTHGHQFAGFINGWRHDVPIPTSWKHGPLPQFYDWAKVLRELEIARQVPAIGARVTRLWSEYAETEGALIAEACGIATVVDSASEAIRDVDAVLLLTDDAGSHLPIAEKSLAAGIPIFIDKPLAPDMETAHRIADIAKERNTPWFSGSAFHFSQVLAALRERIAAEVGTPTTFYVQGPGWIEEYGIHVLEVLNVLAGHEISDIHGIRVEGRNAAILSYENCTALVETIDSPGVPPAQVIVCGERGSIHQKCDDAYLSIFKLTRAFIDMARTGEPPIVVEESLEMADLALRLTLATSSVTG
jgi:predicted dehydrogenase